MKRITTSILPFFISLGLFFSGCDVLKNANNKQKGAAIGSATGAVIGGVIGNNVGNKNNAALGAILGAVVGGVAGGIIGNKMDKQAEKIETTLPGAEVVRTQEGIQVILDENSDVRFAYNKSNLTTDSKANLNKLITIFNEYPKTDILVIGHTDSKGSDAYNQKLSERRANSVVNYLINKGISTSRLKGIGMGEKEPRDTNETKEGRALNRRVEFAITANEQMKEDARQEAGK